jgi:hypothetical protein
MGQVLAARERELRGVLAEKDVLTERNRHVALLLDEKTAALHQQEVRFEMGSRSCPLAVKGYALCQQVVPFEVDRSSSPLAARGALFTSKDVCFVM